MSSPLVSNAVSTTSSRSVRARLCRRRGFSCRHRYAVEEWSAAKNSDIFGACFTPHGHGHNYEVEACVEGPIDPTTGMIMNLSEVDELLAKVVEPLDGKHLNFEVPAFKAKMPTTENIAGWLFSELSRQITEPARLIKLRLYEYADLWVDVWAE